MEELSIYFSSRFVDAFSINFNLAHLVLILGIALVVIGQSLRSLAMIHAAANFSHQVAYQKEARHRLVTDGIYA